MITCLGPLGARAIPTATGGFATMAANAARTLFLRLEGVKPALTREKFESKIKDLQREMASLTCADSDRKQSILLHPQALRVQRMAASLQRRTTDAGDRTYLASVQIMAKRLEQDHLEGEGRALIKPGRDPSTFCWEMRNKRARALVESRTRHVRDQAGTHIATLKADVEKLRSSVLGRCGGAVASVNQRSHADSPTRGEAGPIASGKFFQKISPLARNIRKMDKATTSGDVERMDHYATKLLRSAEKINEQCRSTDVSDGFDRMRSTFGVLRNVVHEDARAIAHARAVDRLPSVKACVRAAQTGWLAICLDNGVSLIENFIDDARNAPLSLEQEKLIAKLEDQIEALMQRSALRENVRMPLKTLQRTAAAAGAMLGHPRAAECFMNISSEISNLVFLAEQTRAELSLFNRNLSQAGSFA